MVGALLDTCIISELQKPHPHPGVEDLLQQYDPNQLFISVLSIGEIAKGIALLPANNRRASLFTWLKDLQKQFADQLLPIDSGIAKEWGSLTANAQQHGQAIPAIDGLIAATGLTYNLAIMTRNTTHFAATGARVIDPWK